MREKDFICHVRSLQADGHFCRQAGAEDPGPFLAVFFDVLHFGPEVVFARTGDAEADILAATQQCGSVTEEWIRRYPDQWLWIHRRWKTRPAGEPPIY